MYSWQMDQNRSRETEYLVVALSRLGRPRHRWSRRSTIYYESDSEFGLLFWPMATSLAAPAPTSDSHSGPATSPGIFRLLVQVAG